MTVVDKTIACKDSPGFANHFRPLEDKNWLLDPKREDLGRKEWNVD